MSNTFPKTSRNKVKRIPERGHYDSSTIYPIIDEAMICHVGFIHDDQPFVIPTLHARQGDMILLHGAKGSRLLRHIESGGDVCISITLVDGIVLARSVFHHSINYRSVVVFGTPSIAHRQRCERDRRRTKRTIWICRSGPGCCRCARRAEIRSPTRCSKRALRSPNTSVIDRERVFFPIVGISPSRRNPHDGSFDNPFRTPLDAAAPVLSIGEHPVVQLRERVV